MKAILTLVLVWAVSPWAAATSGIPVATPDLSGSITIHSGADITVQNGAAGEIDLARDSLRKVSMLEPGRAGQIVLEGGSIAVLKPDYRSGIITIASSVPEPETYVMLLAGLGVVGIGVRRRKA